MRRRRVLCRENGPVISRAYDVIAGASWDRRDLSGAAGMTTGSRMPIARAVFNVVVSGAWLTLEASGRWLVRWWWWDKTCGLDGRF